MYAHDKRHSCGLLMPNFFFLLQITAIAIFSYILVSMIPLLNLSIFSVYAIGVLATGAILICIHKRQKVIRRQRFC